MGTRGWIYIITNKAMPGLLKIGFSTKDPLLRAKELANTGTPHTYNVEYDLLLEEPRDVEQQIHRSLSHWHENKEWFRCSVYDAIKEIRNLTNGKGLLENVRCDEYINSLSSLLEFPTTSEEITCWYYNCNERATNVFQNHNYCEDHYNVLREHHCRPLSSEQRKLNRAYSINRLKDEVSSNKPKDSALSIADIWLKNKR